MRRLIIILLVLVGLVVVADFGAAALAESAFSRQMRSQLGLVDDPSVRFNGFPFLTQAISGTYSSIDVDATRIPYGSFKELEINAQLVAGREKLDLLDPEANPPAYLYAAALHRARTGDRRPI